MPISDQYKVFNDRIKMHNHLLWNNFIAYGAICGGLMTWLNKCHMDHTLRVWVIFGAFVFLFMSGIIQCTLVKGLKICITNCVTIESHLEREFIRLTKPVDGNEFTTVSAYTYASVCML